MVCTDNFYLMKRTKASGSQPSLMMQLWHSFFHLLSGRVFMVALTYIRRRRRAHCVNHWHERAERATRTSKLTGSLCELFCSNVVTAFAVLSLTFRLPDEILFPMHSDGPVLSFQLFIWKVLTILCSKHNMRRICFIEHRKKIKTKCLETGNVLENIRHNPNRLMQMSHWKVT